MKFSYNEFWKYFTLYCIYEGGKKISFGMSYEFNILRKLSKSLENRAAVISIPRSIAQAWEQYQSVNLVFDGDCLIIKPIRCYIA
jgi:hypothetical protein